MTMQANTDSLWEALGRLRTHLLTVGDAAGAGMLDGIVATYAGAHEEVLDLMQVAKALGITYKSARNYNQWGQLPKPDIMLGASPGWYASTIQQHKDKLAERKAKQAAALAERRAARARLVQKNKAEREKAAAARKQAAAEAAKAKAAARAAARALMRPVPLPMPTPPQPSTNGTTAAPVEAAAAPTVIIKRKVAR